MKNSAISGFLLLLVALVASGAAFAQGGTRVQGGNSTLQGTSSQQVKATRGDLIGVFVASSTTCTIKLWNSAAGSGAVLVDTFSAAAATWYPLPFRFSIGLYITTTGTCSYTISYYL